MTGDQLRRLRLTIRILRRRLRRAKIGSATARALKRSLKFCLWQLGRVGRLRHFGRKK